MDIADDLRLGERQQIIVALEIGGVIGKALTTIVCLREPVSLNHRTHGAVEHENPCREQLIELRQAGNTIGNVQIGHWIGFRAGAVWLPVKFTQMLPRLRHRGSNKLTYRSSNSFAPVAPRRWFTLQRSLSAAPGRD